MNLEFRNIHKAFGARQVFTGLSASVPLAETTYVVGLSGGGKSVLCKLAVGLASLDQGELFLDGHPIHALPRRELVRLRRQFPYVVQGPALLDWLTLAENVALADPRATPDQVQQALARVGLAEQSTQLPPQVSPGVAKRAALARAILLKPRYLLLDEPTTGLDRQAASEVNTVFGQLRRDGLGSLVVSHDYAALRQLADRVLVVAGGKAVFHGTPEAFYASELPEVRALTAPGEE